MRTRPEFGNAVAALLGFRLTLVTIATTACLCQPTTAVHGESIVVEQGNQVVRTGNVQVQNGEQMHVRDPQSKLDLEQALAVNGGTVRLESGGRLNTNTMTGHSRLVGLRARAIVDGPNSIWTVGGYMEVGDDGEAHLVISNGGKVRSGLVPDNRSRVSGAGNGAPASTATITGAGSIWDVGSNLEIGDSGEAHLIISNGGKVMSGQDGERSRVSGAGGPSEAASSATIEGAGSLDRRR